MRYLLDTQILLWAVEGSKKLKIPVEEVIKNPKNQIFVSVINGIEISIKSRSGKLKIQTNLKKIFESLESNMLNINFKHILELDALPVYHKDPFDRILIAQAKTENLTLITSDKKILKYNIALFQA